jgi:hypothetical protein
MTSDMIGPAFLSPATAAMAKINNNPDKKYSVRVIRPEKEKGALNIEKQGVTPKLRHYNPGHWIIRHSAAFLIDNGPFIRDFCAIGTTLSILLLAPLLTDPYRSNKQDTLSPPTWPS